MSFPTEMEAIGPPVSEMCV